MRILFLGLVMLLGVAKQARPRPATITVSPSSVTIAINTTQQFTAVGRDASGNVVPFTPVWSVVAGGGTIDANGLFTAGGVIATYTDTVKASSGSIFGTATVIENATGGVPPNLVFTDFNTGVLNPSFTYSSPGPGGEFDIVNDPTGSGRIKVARFRYQHFSSPDRNIAINYAHNHTFGEPLYFKGDFYLPVADFSNPLRDRKLLYWQCAASAIPTMFNRAVVGISGNPGGTWSNNLGINTTYDPQPGFGINDDSVRTVSLRLAQIEALRWYTLEFFVQMETTLGGTNGIMRLWLDGVLLYENTSLTWSDPNWIAGIPCTLADIKFRTHYVGQQVNDNTIPPNSSYDEYRYWDNVGFSTQRITA